MPNDVAAADGPYVFHASKQPLRPLSPGVLGKEARMPDGLVVRYQERQPGHDGDHWCDAGHTVYVVAGRIRYEFADSAAEAGPGDIVHIPAGHAHRHRPHVLGSEPVKYFVTEFFE